MNSIAQPSLNRTRPRFFNSASFLLASLAMLTIPIASSAASANWTGLTDSTWANTGNWDASPVPGTGDTATFNGGGNGNTIIDLGTGVTVGNVTFDTSLAAPYTIGAGAVGSQTLTLDLNGGINMGTTVTSNQIINANLALPAIGFYNIINNSAANVLTLAGTNKAATTGSAVLTMDGTGTNSITGPIQAGTGSMGLYKINTGTLLLSGGGAFTATNVNSYQPGVNYGPVDLLSGTTIISGGAYTNTGEWVVGGVVANGGAGNNVNFTMNGGSLGISTWFSLGRGNGIGGVSSDVVLNNSANITAINSSLGYNANNVANLPKGTVTLNNNSWFKVNGNFYLGESAGSLMTMTLNDAACFTNLNGLGVSLGRSGGGNVYLNGTGTFFTEGDAIITYNSSGAANNGLVVVNGGTFKVASTTKRWLQVGRAGTSAATLTVNGGAVQLDQNTDIRFNTSTSTGTNSINLESGSITFYSDNATTIGGSGQLDLQQASTTGANNTFNLDGGTITVSNVISAQVNGTRVFNFNGGTLKAASAAASGLVNFFNLGSGNAYANVRNGGAVIDSNGKNILVAQSLLHSSVAGDAATDGGLTKNGTGTLTLSGINTYTGTTRVNQGTLNITGTSLKSQSIVVSDSVTLGVSAPNGASWAPTTMTVGTNTGTAVLNLNAVSTTVAPLAPGTLTFTGSGDTINVVGGTFTAGNSYPLIACTNPIVGSYTAGTLPPGVTGTISTVGNSIVLSVSAVTVTNNIWTGAVSGTWDIGTTANWTNTALGNKYTDGSTVQFDDTGLNTATVSNLTATILSPVSILVTNNTQNYCFKANTIISGNTGITKTGTGNLTNSTPNTYTGPTVINKGGIVVGVASTPNVNGALGLNSAVTLANDSTAVLNLNGNSTQVGSLSGGGPNAGNVVLGAGTLTAGLDNSSTAYAGNISGTGGFVKLGNGTLTLSGTNTATGATIVSQGTLTYASGAVQNSVASFSVGTASGFGTATMNVNSGSTVSFGSVVCNVGYLTGVGVLNITGGTLNGCADLRVGGSDQSGPGFNGSGTVNLNSGAANLSSLTLARGNNFQNTSSGTFNITGGTLISTNDVVCAYAGAGLGKITMNGGTMHVGTTVTKWLHMADWDSTSSEFDLTNGNLNLNAGTSIKYNVQNSAGTHTFNQFGGNVTFYSDFATTVGGAGNLDFDYNSPSGTTAVNTYNLNGGILTTPQITSTKANATRIFNFNGGTIRPTASSANFFNLGAGNATANVRNGGALIDSAGFNITIAQPLVHSTINGDNATDGGLTKIGNGTLTMSGGLSYTGPTKVLGGTLSLNSSLGLPSGGDLVVSNATLTLDASSGVAMSVNNVSVGSTLNFTLSPYANAISAAGNLALGDNTVITLSYGTVLANPTAAAINANSLTKGTNIAFNISAIGFGTGIVPLITAPGLSGTNGFVIASLPSGVKGVLTNSVTGELDLLVTSAGQLLSWHGANLDNTIILTNWDINTSSNWYDINNNLARYLQYSGNTIGDNVVFADLGYNTDGTNHINLGVTVVPATVAFSSSSPYTLTGAGGISGATALVLTNMNNSVYVGTSNSYTGGTLITSGALVISNDTALGAASGPVAMSGGTLELIGGVTNSRSLTLTANSSIGVATNVNARLNGDVTGAGGLTKTDNGTLVLAGTNGTTGTLVVNQGTLVTLGTNVLPAVPLVGNASGYNGVLNVAGGVFNDTFNPANVYNSSLTIGNLAGAAGDMIVSGGVVTIPKQLTIGSAGYGGFSQSAGTTTIGGFIALGGNANGGVLNQTGGIINMTNTSATIGYTATTTFGVMNLSGGAVFNVSGANNGVWPGEVGNGVLTISGSAALNIASDGITLGKANAGASGTVNLNGGTITANFIANGTGLSAFNFNGGTLRANASGAFTRGSSSLAFYDYNGGAVIDDGGNSITFNQPIQPATGYGVASIAVSPGTSSGYIDTPVVTITGGNGSNATATATVSAGEVTGITITCPGSGYLNGDSLSVNFIGGGASPIPPTIGAITFVANGTGGLTKQGIGTLTLAGPNTYAGPTVVNGGELLLTPAYQAGGAVAVADSAKFGISASSVSNSATIGTLTMGSSGATTLDFLYSFGGNPTNAALSAGAVTLNGTCTIHVGGSFALGAFPVLKYSSLSGSFASTVSAPRGMGATVSNDATHSTIYVVVNSLASSIVWTGTNSLPGKTNLWDLNTTTNWLIGASPTTYQETLPPGDAVMFNDIGSGLVLLSNTASPLSMTISNNSVNYAFQGNGQINALAGLTKQGSGTATLSLPGTYSVSTVISAGAVSLATNQTFANLTGGGTVNTDSGTPTLTVNNSTNTTFAGTMQGALSLTKTGNGTLTLTGTNPFTGNVFGKGGTIVIDSGAIDSGTLWTSIGQDGSDNATLTVKGTGSFTNNADFNVGDIGSATGTLNVSDNATLTIGSMYIGSANVAGSTASGTVNQTGGTVQNTFLVIGGRTSTNGVGVYNLSGGTLTDSGSVRIGGVGTGTMNVSGTASAFFGTTSYVGYRSGYGTLNITGGSFSVGGEFRVAGSDASGAQYVATGIVNVANATVNLSSLTIARGNNYQNNINGEVDINSGATVTSTNDVIIGYAGAGHAKLVINGGTFNVATTALKWFMLPEYDTTTGELDITNGALNLNAGSPIRMSSGNNTTGDNVINLEGGSITFYSDFGTTLGGGGRLDLCAGSAGFTGNNTVNLDGGTLTVPQVISSLANGTRVFNFNGGTLKPTGSSTAFFNLNTGDASAYVRTGGAHIDTAGYDVTVDQALLNNGVDEDGGLTKTGNGMLSLNGINTYTNVTTVAAGSLGGNGTIAGAVVVNSGAGLAPGNSIGTLAINGNLTLSAGSTNVFEVNGTTPTNDLVVAGANVSYGGVLQIVPSGSFTVGQTFTLFSGAGTANASNFASVQSSNPGLVFSFTNGVLSVVSTVATNPTNITYTVSGNTLTLSWPADHQGWILQSQTNNLNAGLGANWVDVTGSGSTTQAVMNINPLNPTVFFRLRSP
jgi:fibronectin-binding autotransporter adhesin